MIRVITDYPVALDSPDHLHPRGAIRDNHINLTFNDRLRDLYPEDLSVLDLGCAGGGMVKTLVDQGHLAVGIEGSDWCKKNKALEWVHLADDRLFTADISKPFSIVHGLHGKDFWWRNLNEFKVITLWEVIEHIAEDDLDTLFMNIRNHLSVDDGIVVMSVSPNEEVVDGVRLHQTVQTKEWWRDRLARSGFHSVPGSLSGFSDCMVRNEFNAPGSFHFVLTCIRQYVRDRSGSDIQVGNGDKMSDTVSDDGPPPGFIPAPIHPMDDISPDPTQGGDPLPITEVTPDPTPEVVSDPVPDPGVVAEGGGEDVETPSSDNDHSDHSEPSDQPDAAPPIGPNSSPETGPEVEPALLNPQDDHPLAMLGGPYKIIADHIRAMEKKLNIEGWWR